MGRTGTTAVERPPPPGREAVALEGWWPAEAPPADRRCPWPWLIALMAVAAALRAIALHQQLWYDEMTTLVQTVRPPLGEILTTYTSQNKHMLYSLLAHISTSVFGESNAALRLPAALFGVAAVPALYFCGRLLAPAREAWLAAGLLVASYHHVWFSQNARGYTGMALWTLLATCFFIRGMQESARRWWVWYAVATALGLYTHLTMGFVTAGHFAVYAWLAVARRRHIAPQSLWRPLGGFAGGGVLTLLLYSPVLPQLLRRTVGQAAQARVESDWTSPLWAIFETLRGLAAPAGGRLGVAVLVLAGGIVLAGALSYWRENRYALGLMLAPGMITAVVMAALEHNLWPRFFFFAIGFAFLLLMRGAARCAETAARWSGISAPLRSAAATALGVMLILGSAWTVRSAWLHPKQDYEGAMRFVDAQRRPGESVVVTGLAVFPYRVYHGRDWPAVETAAQLEAVRASGRPVWLLHAFPIFLRSRHPEIWNIVEREFATVRVFRGTIGEGEVFVCKWEPPPAAAAAGKK